MKIPPDILDAFRAVSDGQPTTAVRALADLDGNLGETYIVSDGSALYLFSRKIGEPRQTLRLELAQITAADLEEDRPFLYFHLAAGGRNYRLKCGSFDRGTLQGFADQWAAAATDQPPVAAVSPSATPPKPFIVFAAALQAMLEADGEIGDEERQQLARIVGDPAVHAAATSLLRDLGVGGLLAALPGWLGSDQRLCLIANLLDLAMVDGYLRGSEQTLLAQFRDALAVATDDYDAIYQVLALKNDLSAFSL